MEIKEINLSNKPNTSIKISLAQGSTIVGKILSNPDGSNSIKLYNGSTLPAILLDKNIKDNNFIKFCIEDAKDNTLVLRALDLNTKSELDNNIFLKDLLFKLNIPLDEGNEIINSLIKFNLPTSEKNILTLYKNMESIKNLISMTDDDIITLCNQSFNSITEGNSREASLFKEIITHIKNVDSNFLSFMLKNDIPINLENIIFLNNFLNNKFEINEIIKFLNANNSDGNDLHLFIKSFFDNGTIDSILNSLDASQREELFSKISVFAKNSEIIKSIENNYIIYNFNTYYENKMYKNYLVVDRENKDVNDMEYKKVSAFIAIETPNLGNVEIHLNKTNNILSLKFKTDKKYVGYFKNNSSLLNDLLKRSGYEISNISFEELIKSFNISSMRDTNNTTFKGIDVII